MTTPTHSTPFTPHSNPSTHRQSAYRAIEGKNVSTATGEFVTSTVVIGALFACVIGGIAIANRVVSAPEDTSGYRSTGWYENCLREALPGGRASSVKELAGASHTCARYAPADWEKSARKFLR